jgi:hypothetical protein
MVQELIWMKQLSEQLKNKLVVWFICVSNDLHYNLLPNLEQYRAPFVRRPNGVGEWEIVTSHVGPARWPMSVDGSGNEKFLEAFGAGLQSQRAYSACEFLIAQGKNICDSAGAPLVVMTIPWLVQLNEAEWRQRVSRLKNLETFDRDLPDKKLGQICARVGVPFVAGKTYLNARDYIAQEGHWNESGHRRIARAMADLHQRFIGTDRTSTEEKIYSDGTLHASVLEQ